MQNAKSKITNAKLEGDAGEFNRRIEKRELANIILNFEF
jgi:hypothetical protein